MVGKDLIMATLLGSGGGSSGSGGGIPQEDIDAAFAALAKKGVTVPDGATSADLDDLIASIVAGGGGAGTIFGRNYETGTFALATRKSNAYIKHSLGAVPTGAIWWTEADFVSDTSQPYEVFGAAIYTDVENGYGLQMKMYKDSETATTLTTKYGTKTPSGTIGKISVPTVTSATSETVYSGATEYSVSMNGVSARFPAGVEYKYILLGGMPE